MLEWGGVIVISYSLNWSVYWNSLPAYCLLAILCFFFFSGVDLLSTVSLCRLLLQPPCPPYAPPRLFFPLLRGAGRGHSGGKQIIYKHFPKRKKKKFTLTYTDATTSSDSHRLRPERRSSLGITWQEHTGAKWIFHYYSSSFLFNLGVFFFPVASISHDLVELF